MRKSSMAGLALAVALAGCAGLNTVESDVSTYSTWPAERKPASYSFERLPSQESRPQEQDKLEMSARRALELSGFTEASDATTADVKIQLGLRVNRADRLYYDDPFWWRGGLFYSHRGYGGMWGSGLAFQFDSPYYEREVALLIRDRASNQTLFEAHAGNDGNTPGNDALIGALFEAAMKDFPHTGINPRRVTVALPQ